MAETKPHYWGHRQRLRKKFLDRGLESLADYEAVELLLTLAIPRSDVKVPAKALIIRFGNLKGILDAPVDELNSIPGLGSVAPAALKIIKAAATLYLQQSAENADVLSEFSKIRDFWRMRIGAQGNETFQVAFLDSGCRLLRNGVETIEEGTIDRAAVYPRRVVESAIRRNAAVIIVAHNHPNGDGTPSEQDKLITRALVLACDTVNIKVMDHLIVTSDDVFSFRKAGLL